MGEEEKAVETPESTDTQELDINDLIDTGEQETETPEAEPTDESEESTDTPSEEEDGTPAKDEGTLLPDDLREKYGINTEEELAEKLKKSENADKAIYEQGRELGELRKLKEEVEAIKQQEAQSSEVNAYENFKKTVNQNFNNTVDLVQKALTDENFDVKDVGKSVVGAVSTFVAENVVQPMIRQALAEYDSSTKQTSNYSQRVKALHDEVIKEFPNLDKTDSPLYVKTKEIMSGINPHLLRDKENAMTLLKIAAKSAASTLKGGNIPNQDMEKAIKKIEEKEAGKVLTRKKAPAPKPKSDIENLIATKSGASGSGLF